ncbi:MAG: class I SAM-dependent methyltransferase [Alphaproteobacteria bacterium]|nr:class I SAM-dependent methyltransferase [Alphaproteobacteria bacterium]
MVAIYNLHKECEEQGIPSGYEELFKALPSKMVDMALFILDEVADAAELKNVSMELVKTGKEIRRIKNNPRKYIEGIEKKSSFRQGELECFQTNNLDGYMYEMFRKDIPFGRNCLTSHDYGRSAYLDLCIREAIGKGSRQIVVPACGLDTTPERLASEYSNVQFYLSDLPSIVEERSELIKNEKFSNKFFADGRYPENIHWASVDLSNANGLTKLLRNEASFDSGQRTTYVFSGITMYLKPETVQETIANLARMTPLFDMFIGIASRSTRGEAKMVRGTYKGNAFLPLYQVQEMVGEIGEGLIV